MPAAGSLEVKNFGAWEGGAAGFSLIEVLVVITLLSLIVLVLMSVFSSTQRAFRAAVTQTDVLEGSREAMQLIAADLRTITPSFGVSNGPVNLMEGPTYYAYTPLLQSLPGAFDSSGNPIFRTNVLNYFFFLSRENTRWIGVGYAVNAYSSSPLFPLYRFYTNQDISLPPRNLYDAFTNVLYFQRWTNANMSHLIDGVVHLSLRGYDVNGILMQYNYTNARNAEFYNSASSYGEPIFNLFSNTVPAAVELDLGVLEDRALARAESLSQNPKAQSNYLSQQSGSVHVFRQRVSIPNVDPSAYQ